MEGDVMMRLKEQWKNSCHLQVFPDEKTHDQLFNGIKFTDIPIVLMRLHRNNTKLNAMCASFLQFFNIYLKPWM